MKIKFAITSFLPLYVLALSYMIPGLVNDELLFWLSPTFYSVCVLGVLFFLGVLFAKTAFLVRKRDGRLNGAEIISCEQIKGDALSFYGAILIPLISICQTGSLGGLLCFWLSLFLALVLIIKTNDYMNNPVMILLKYRNYKVKYRFDEEEKVTYVLSGRKLNEGSIISATTIDDDLILVYRK